MAERKKSTAQLVELECEIEWAKVFGFNRDKTGPDGVWEETEGRTSVVAKLTQEQFKYLKSLGVQKQAKDVDDQGRIKVQFTRKWVDKFPNWGGAPRVLNADGSDFNPDEQGLIGNGTKAIVFISVYQAGKLVGTRLEGLQVLDLVEYVSDKPATENYSRVPAIDRTKKDTKSFADDEKGSNNYTENTKQELDDEIPF